MAASKPNVRNVYFKDEELFKDFMDHCKKQRLPFSHVACDAFRMYLKVKRQEEEAIKKADIRIY